MGLRRHFTRALVVAVSLVGMPAASVALETDQFTVPERALPDLGPELDLKVDVALRMLVREANDALAKGGKAAEAARHNDFFAERIAGMWTGGVPECTIESWVRRTDFGDDDARFHVSIGQSVYGKALIGRPITLVTLAPTVNLYGHYVGTDKVGHFFQQGWEYYQAYREVRDQGKTNKEAVRVAVTKGVAQEQGIYGLFVVDTYSNADLAADLAGLMFYRNLTETVVLPDGVVLRPMLVMRDGRWELNALAGDAHCRPLISDHWDESCNPNLYAPMLRRIVEENVREHGKRWVAFRRTTRQQEERRLEEMKLWHGIEYGHSGYKGVVTIVGGYFDAVPEGAGRTAVAVKK